MRWTEEINKGGQMTTYPCSVCGNRSNFITLDDQEAIDEGNESMCHVHIPTWFSGCGHTGYFRWTKKEWRKSCKNRGITPKFRLIKEEERERLMRYINN